MNGDSIVVALAFQQSVEGKAFFCGGLRAESSRSTVDGVFFRLRRATLLKRLLGLDMSVPVGKKN